MTDNSTTRTSVSMPDEYAVVTGPATVRIERMLPGPIERVWSYLTDSNKRGTWLAAGEMDLRVGGRVEHIFHNNTLTEDDDPPPQKHAGSADEHRLTGRILALDPPRLLQYSWFEGDNESELRIELTPVGAKVRLVLTHSRLGNRNEMVGVSGGWHAHLDVLAARLSDREPDGFWRSFNRLEAEYEERIPESV